MSDELSLEVAGLDGIERALGILASCFDADSMLQIHNGIIRPTPGPPGMPSIMRKRWSIEEQIAEAFENEGQTVNQSGWARYGAEPKYAAYKQARKGGTQVGIWQNAESPLKDTFLRKDHPDHIEYVRFDGFGYGSKRYYAWNFHEGQYQPWDGVQAPARRIFQVTDRFLAEVARGHQRYVMGKLRAEGRSVDNVRIVI